MGTAATTCSSPKVTARGCSAGQGTDTLYEEHGITKYWLGDGTDTLSLALSRNPVYICAKATGRWTSGGRASPEDGAAYGYGADIIVGSPYRDVIKGNRYNDVIFGGGGRDIINPGRGDDAVFAGRGDDQIISQDGQRDDIVGGIGSDRAKADRADNVTSAVLPTPPSSTSSATARPRRRPTLKRVAPWADRSHNTARASYPPGSATRRTCSRGDVRRQVGRVSPPAALHDGRHPGRPGAAARADDQRRDPRPTPARPRTSRAS